MMTGERSTFIDKDNRLANEYHFDNHKHRQGKMIVGTMANSVCSALIKCEGPNESCSPAPFPLNKCSILAINGHCVFWWRRF